jgi:hypothetical protein
VGLQVHSNHARDVRRGHAVRCGSGEARVCGAHAQMLWAGPCKH